MPPPAIGPFEIIRELGRGGMGEVHLARDSRLGRNVAIKALPAHLMADPDRMARFQREARVLASMNHPGVGAIYGIEESAGQQYLILEYVQGTTLADRLKRGAIPIDEALVLARHIAEALEAAHEKGVVHRDLKPGNVMVTPDGGAKVLDFGLARTDESARDSSSAGTAPSDVAAPSAPPASAAPPASGPGAVTAAPSETLPATVPIRRASGDSPTIAGAIMGTAGYMSPEQARGKAVDKRADIFAFGCVLFEMLTGIGPFVGESIADSLGAVLHREPAWDQLPAATPPRVRELLASCMVKERRNRLHDIADARLQLDRAIAGREWAGVAAGGPAPSSRPRLATLAAIAVLAIGVGLAAGYALAPQRTPPPAPTSPPPPEIPTPDPVRFVIPSNSTAYGNARVPVISRDGKSVAFTAIKTGGTATQLWIRPVDSFEARPLAETDTATDFFWSWDSRTIAFHAEGKLWAVDAVRGGARRLIAAIDSNNGASWGPDGTILLAQSDRSGARGEIVAVPAAGGPPRAVTKLDESAFEKIHVCPAFLPDGKRFLFLAVDFDPSAQVRRPKLFVGQLDSPARTPIPAVAAPAWPVDGGHLVFAEDGAVKSVAFDPATLRITGEPAVLADGVRARGPGRPGVSVAANGAVAFDALLENHELAWFDSTGMRFETVGQKALYGDVRISPDGTRIATSIQDKRTGASDLWILGVDRPSARRLTTDARSEIRPVWSPDGNTLYYSWDKDDVFNLYATRADGAGDTREIFGPGSGGRIWNAASVSPDGKHLLAHGNFESLGSEIRIIPLHPATTQPTTSPATTRPAASAFWSSPADERAPRISPDGRWVAFASDESGKTEIYLAEFPFGPRPASTRPAPTKILLAPSGTPFFAWAPTGDKLYYVQGVTTAGVEVGFRRIMVVDLKTPADFAQPPPPRMLFETTDRIGAFDITPDGKRFLLRLLPVELPPMGVVIHPLPPRK